MSEDITIVIITLLFSAFFSGIEIAFVSSNRLKLELDKSSDSFISKIIVYLFSVICYGTTFKYQIN